MHSSKREGQLGMEEVNFIGDHVRVAEENPQDFEY